MEQVTREQFLSVSDRARSAIEHTIKIERPQQKRWIYFLLDCGRVVYVGQTVWGVERILSHRRDKQFDSYAYFTVDDSEANAAEAQLILSLDPVYNMSIPSGGGYETIQRLKNMLRVSVAEVKRRIRDSGIGPVVAHGQNYYETAAVMRDA